MTLRILSLGAGVQSTTIALMVKDGELPMIDCAIFADTQDEPASVYRHLRWLTSGILPFPVHIVTIGKLSSEIIAAASGNSRNDARPPFYLINPDGSRGMLNRQCTQDYKLDPIRRKVRELLGVGPHDPIAPGTLDQWIGFSYDEILRMKPSRQRYIVNHFPLIEKKKMTRTDCLRWMETKGYARPPRSACVFCPYHNDDEWNRLKIEEREEFAKAVAIDKIIREPGHMRARGSAYLHDSRRPLDEIDFDALIRKREDKKHQQPDLFINDCDGMCGV